MSKIKHRPDKDLRFSIEVMVWIASSFLLAMTKTQLTKTDAADVGELRVDCRHTAGGCPLILPRTHRERFQKQGLCRQLQRRAGEVGQERLAVRSFCRVDDFPTPLTVSPDRVDYGETIGAKKRSDLRRSVLDVFTTE